MTRWQLSREALDSLLQTLAPDREEAALAYESLRARLTDFFTWEGDPDPDSLADETLNRLARRVQEGEPIRNPNSYAVGIARLILLEAARSRQKQDIALREMPAPSPASESDEMQAMNRCLQSLSRENRDLIERYYSMDRDRLAQSLGVSVNTLRNRALRIRQRLFDCIRRTRDASRGAGHHE